MTPDERERRRENERRFEETLIKALTGLGFSEEEAEFRVRVRDDPAEERTRQKLNQDWQEDVLIRALERDGVPHDEAVRRVRVREA